MIVNKEIHEIFDLIIIPFSFKFDLLQVSIHLVDPNFKTDYDDHY